MIKFFRKIRQSLLTENRFLKYLIYAVGEIVLVVIGILIALSINNWNQDQMIRKTELTLLDEMKNNLKADLADIDFNISFNEVRLNSNKIVFEALKNPIKYNDTLNFYYANLSSGTYFAKNTSAYDNLKSIGFQIIKTDSLRSRITQLYSTTYRRIDILESRFSNDFYSSKLEPLLINNLITDSLWYSAKPINQFELAKNHEFKEILKLNISWIKFMIDEYKKIKLTILTLINQIENEIKGRSNLNNSDINKG